MSSHNLYSNFPPFFSVPSTKLNVCPSNINGLSTPPLSPCEHVRKPSSSRFKLPRCFRRNQPTQSPSPLSSRRLSDSSSYLPDQEDFESCRGLHSPTSPFQRVQEMKQSFAPIHPASPPLYQYGRGTKPQIPTPLTSSQSEIRKFRSYAHLGLPPKPVGLLPSPDFREKNPANNDNDSRFGYRHPRGDGFSADVNWCPCTWPSQEMCLISSYEDKQFDQSSEEQGAPSNIEKPRALGKESGSPSSVHSYSPVRDEALSISSRTSQSSPKLKERSRSTTLSSEAEWLAGTMSYRQSWLQDNPDEESLKASRRRCQCVQHPNRDFEMQSQDSTFQFFATVVKPRKPKLVTISRPSSVWTDSPTQTKSECVNKRAMTPEHTSQVSKFSPYTPSDTREDSGYASRLSHEDDSADGNPTNYCAPTTPTALPCSFDECYGSTEPAAATSIIAQNESSAINQDQVGSDRAKLPFHCPPPVLPPDTDQATWDRCRELELILNELNDGVIGCPYTALRLDNPLVMQLRNARFQDDDYLLALRNIFPGAADLLLSALCATLIVALHLASEACASLASAPSVQANFTKETLDKNNNNLNSIPAKARATLGIHLPNATPAQLKERVLRRKAEMVRERLGENVERLIEVICGRCDGVIKRAVSVVVEVAEKAREDVQRSSLFRCHRV